MTLGLRCFRIKKVLHTPSWIMHLAKFKYKTTSIPLLFCCCLGHVKTRPRHNNQAVPAVRLNRLPFIEISREKDQDLRFASDQIMTLPGQPPLENVSHFPLKGSRTISETNQRSTKMSTTWSCKKHITSDVQNLLHVSPHKFALNRFWSQNWFPKFKLHTFTKTSQWETSPIWKHLSLRTSNLLLFHARHSFF